VAAADRRTAAGGRRGPPGRGGRPAAACGPGGRGRVRAAVRPGRTDGARRRAGGGPQPRAVGGGHAGGARRGLADLAAVRPRAGQCAFLADHDGAAPGRGPCPLGAGRRGPRRHGRCPVRRAGRRRRVGGGRDPAGAAAGPPLRGWADRAPTGGRVARLLLRSHSPRGVAAPRRPARNDQDSAAGRSHPAARLPGGGVMDAVERADVHTLIGAYALDALEDDEREEFERHLADCEPCREEVVGFRRTAVRLAEAAAVVPPPRMHGRVMQEIAATPQVRDTPGTPVRGAGRRMPPRSRLWLAAAAVLAVASVGLGGVAWNQYQAAQDARRTSQAITQILADRQAHAVTQRLPGGANATLVVAQDRAVLAGSALPALPDDRT